MSKRVRISQLRVVGLGLALLLVTGAAGSANSSPPLLPQDLKASWPMADAASGSAGDSTGNGQTATLQGGASFGQGKIGRALSLNGVDGAATVAPSDMVAGTSGVSVAGWINMASLPGNGQFREIFSASIGGGPSNSSRIAVATRGNGTSVDVFAGARTADGGSMQSTLAVLGLGQGTWHHVVANFDFPADTIEIWLDGVLAHSATVAFTNDSTPATNSESIAIGAQDLADSNFFHGSIDELKVFSRTLTQPEIEELADGLGAKLLLHFEESGGATVEDSSINNEDGTLMGGATRVPGPMGSAVKLNGTDGYVKLMDNSGTTALTNEVTVSAWVRIDAEIPDGTFQELVSLSVNDAGGGPTATSRIAFALRGDASGTVDIWAGARTTDTTNMKSLLDDANLAVTGEFVHLAGVFDLDDGFISTFVNGVLSATTPAPFEQPHTANTPGTNGAIGAQDDGGSNFLNGAVDCVRVYCKALTASEIQRLVIRDGLKAEWAADEAAGATTLADTSGGGVDGTLQGGADFVPGQFGNALELNGTDGTVILPNDLAIFQDVEAMSFAGWINMDSLPANGSFYEIISISVNGSPGTNSSRFAFALRGDGAAADLWVGARDTDSGSMQSTLANADIAAGTFRHVATTVDVARDLIRVYLDGQLIHSATVTYANDRTPNTPSTNSAIGAQDAGGSNFFHGKLDAMKLYCRALTATEVAELATVAPPIAPTNLQADGGDGVVNVMWDAVSGATSYNIYRSLTSGTGFSVIGNTVTTSFNDTDVVNDTTYFYKAKSVNAAGESVAFSNEDDATPTAGALPLAPTITSPADGSFLNDTTPVVTGTSEASGLTITVTVDGNVNGTTTSAMGGAWSLTLPTALAEGTHSIVAFATNSAGDSPDSSPAVGITIDTIAPLVFGPVPDNGDTTFDTTPVISASWSDSNIDLATAAITLNGNPVVPQSLTTTGFTFTPVTPLGLTSHTLTAAVNDLAGNQSNLLQWSFTVVAPPSEQIPPIITIDSPQDGSTTTNPREPLSATITDSGGSGVDPTSILVTLNTVVIPSEDVTVTFPNPMDPDTVNVAFVPAFDLNETSNVYLVDAQDNAGNDATDQAVTFTVSTGVNPITLNSLTPLRVGPRARIRVLGAELVQAGGESAVVFTGGVQVQESEYESSSPTQIILRVPYGAVTGPVSVTVGTRTSNEVQIEVVQPFSTDPLASHEVFDGDGFPAFTLNDLDVEFEDFQGLGEAETLAATFSGQVIGYRPASNTFCIRFSSNSVTELLAIRDSIEAQSNVRQAMMTLGFAPRTLRPQDTSVDTRIMQGDVDLEGRTGVWAYDRTQAIGAWRVLEKVSHQLTAIRVGVFDTGVSQTHTEFINAALPNRARLMEVNAAGQAVAYTGTDANGHGTLVTGLIAAARDGVGIDGILLAALAQRNLQTEVFIWPSPLQNNRDPRARFYYNELTAAVDQADRLGATDLTEGVRVINVSNGREIDDLSGLIRQADPTIVDTAVSDAIAIGEIRRHNRNLALHMVGHPSVLLVLAAGNTSDDVSQTADLFGSFYRDIANTPLIANPGNVLIVGGIDHGDNRWIVGTGTLAGSNFGPSETDIDIAAPAKYVLTSYPTGVAAPANTIREKNIIQGNAQSRHIIASGTSLAAPMVTAAAGLLLSIDHEMEGADVRDRLQDSALEASVEISATQRVKWKSLKIADAVVQRLLDSGLSEDQVPSATYVYTTQVGGGFTGISRFSRVRRNGQTYVASEREDFVPPLQGRRESAGMPTISPDGQRLFFPDYATSGESRLIQLLVSNSTRTTIRETTAPILQCPNAGDVRPNVIDFPHMMATGSIIFHSMHERVCNDRSFMDIYRLDPQQNTDNLQNGTLNRLTHIGAQTPVTWVFFNNNAIVTPQNNNLEVPVVWDDPFATQDGRWVGTTNYQDTGNTPDPGRLYLLDMNQDGIPQAVANAANSNGNSTQFVAAYMLNSGAVLEGVANPAISPDGTLIAYISRSANCIMIALLDEDLQAGRALYRPYVLERVLETNVSSDPSMNSPIFPAFFNLAWSPDGSFLLFSNPSAGTGIFVINVSTGEYIRGAANVGVFSSELTPVPGTLGSFRRMTWGWSE